MPSDKLKSLIKPVVLTQKVIWFALFASMIFYVFFAYFFLTRNQALTSNYLEAYGIIIYIVAVVSAVASVWYYRKSLSDTRLSYLLSASPDAEKLALDFKTRKADDERLAALKSLDVRELVIYSLMLELQKVTMIVMILNEIVLICGFILAFMTDDPYKIFPFAAAAIVLSVWMFPRAGRLIERARAL